MNVILKKKKYLLAVIILLVSTFGFIRALFFQIQNGEEITPTSAFEVSFYYLIPAIFWVLLLPFVQWISIKLPITSPVWKRNFLLHVLISALGAPFLRILILFTDFSIKYLLGIMDTNPLTVLFSVKWIIVGTSTSPFMYYWFVLFFFQIVENFEKMKKKNQEKKYLVVKDGLSNKLVPQESIYFLEADGNYVKIHTKEYTYKVRNTLKGIMQQLDQTKFHQVHRSVITQPLAIDNLKHWRNGEYLIHLKNNKIITSSRSYKTNIQVLLGK